IVSGTCTSILRDSLTVQPIPTAPIVTDGNRCDPGIVVLSASGAPPGGKYSWYNSSTGGNRLDYSMSGIFVTPNLTNTTIYYVALTNNAGCEGPRTAVAATITILATSTGSAQTVCESAAPLQLTGFSPIGGIWSGPGVSPSGLFTPSN